MFLALGIYMTHGKKARLKSTNKEYQDRIQQKEKRK